MFDRIKKRNGEIVKFEAQKITNAIYKAGQATGEFGMDIAKKLTLRVLDLAIDIIGDKVPSVEEIQDIVEEVLITSPYKKTAKAYIIYREQHARIREITTKANLDLVNQYLEKTDWRVNENSNMSFSLQGLNNYVSSEITKTYWLNSIYPPEVRFAYINGDIHIHDLGCLSAYCVGWDLQDLLTVGFKGAIGKVESNSAKHFRTALGQIVNFFYTLQGEAAGAQAFSNFDTLLAPFVRYDGLGYKEVKQALQEFLFNVNVPTRVGFQTPFTNITMDLQVPSIYKDQPVIVGGEIKKETYGEFQREMDMLNRAFLEAMLEGDAKGRVFTFPIPTYNITKDFDWDNENTELLWKVTAKYGIPYFSNFVNSDMRPDDVRSMCIDANEEILIRNSRKIKRLSIKEVAESYKKEDFDKEGWADSKRRDLESLSLNPQTLKLEWVPIKRFLKILDKEGVEITTEDGKKTLFSLKHPVAVYTPEGIKMKWAKGVKEGDYVLVLKKANENIFTREYQKIDDITLDEDLSKILGYFVADGNYLFENRKGYKHFGEPKGLQFSFKSGDLENLNLIKSLFKKVFNVEGKEKQDPRYNTYYLYFYNTRLARKFFNAGFRKYGRLPQVLFNSSHSVIENFLEFFFKGDGYDERKEIRINDLELSRDLVLLFSLIGSPVTYRMRKNSQVIYLQHSKTKIKKSNGWMNTPILAERVPGWMTISTSKVPGLSKSRMIGMDTLEKYKAHTSESVKIKNGDIYLARVKQTKIKKYKKLKEFYDIELERNHLFVHSLGQISFNCCRLRLETTELKRRGGGLFGANPLTGSVGVVTINMPRLGYLAKSEDDFFNRLEKLMVISKESLEIKRKIIEKLTDEGLYPYSAFYLRNVKERFGKYWTNHFSTIGIIGMNEACLNLFGKDIGTPEGKAFTIKVMKFMREKLLEFQKETDNFYNLEATPAEGTSYRFAKIDK
ncbi:MAG: ribonucleoside triphosphate reductase, partial [Candidatus Omnitrophica bacterium]|nr:ribonucleoside triphosphate reductase [Candidatus Omnitrophota bacterium]